MTCLDLNIRILELSKKIIYSAWFDRWNFEIQLDLARADPLNVLTFLFKGSLNRKVISLEDFIILVKASFTSDELKYLFSLGDRLFYGSEELFMLECLKLSDSELAIRKVIL